MAKYTFQQGFCMQNGKACLMLNCTKNKQIKKNYKVMRNEQTN